MPVPLLAIAGAAQVAGGLLASRKGKRGRASRTRRRKARLTQGDKMELMWIKQVIGKTAAANALPYYMGRGRG